MRDHDDRHAQLFLQILHQFQNLRLNGYIQRRGRLIRDQNIRFARQRHGDHHALPHTARKLIGILLQALFRFVDAHQREHLLSARLRLFTVAPRMNADRLHQLIADGVYGVQGRHRILEYDRNLIAADLAHFIIGKPHQLLPVEADAAAYDAAGMGQYLQYGIGGHALAGAGFANDAQHLAVIQIKRYAVYRLYLARGRKEGGS